MCQPGFEPVMYDFTRMWITTEPIGTATTFHDGRRFSCEKQRGVALFISALSQFYRGFIAALFQLCRGFIPR